MAMGPIRATCSNTIVIVAFLSTEPKLNSWHLLATYDLFVAWTSAGMAREVQYMNSEQPHSIVIVSRVILVVRFRTSSRLHPYAPLVIVSHTLSVIASTVLRSSPFAMSSTNRSGTSNRRSGSKRKRKPRNTSPSLQVVHEPETPEIVLEGEQGGSSAIVYETSVTASTSSSALQGDVAAPISEPSTSDGFGLASDTAATSQTQVEEDEGFESEWEDEVERQSSDVDEDTKEEVKKSKNGQTMNEFIPELPRLLRLLLEGEASPQVLELCDCQSGLPRVVQCHDCFNAPPSCEECFLRAHSHHPLHWPKVWQPGGYFKKMDISCLRNGTYSIHICLRETERCATPGRPQKVTIVDTNGVHGTRICYCNCVPPDSGDEEQHFKLKQLMRARLFPASVKAPRTLMTFRVMDSFNEHNLASKKSAYDFVGALMRLTDGCFTARGVDPYQPFLLACRIWRRLCLDKWTGQAYNFGAQFPHRTPGSLVLFCPACPEEGFNMEPGWERTPEHLKHLNQLRYALDGNFHLNQYKKNHDPNDVFLENAQGIGYFPDKTEEKRYLSVAPETEEKSTCNYLNVVNNQNKKKFKNMKYSGVVNAACGHSFILSSVNLIKGEGFRFTDLALKHALSHTRHVPYCPQPSPASVDPPEPLPEEPHCPQPSPASVDPPEPLPEEPHCPQPSPASVDPPEPLPEEHRCRVKCAACDILLSYDCNCQYCVNMHARFAASFPGYLDIIKVIRSSIPSLHIKDHKIDCLFKFNNAYMPSGGHHYGEYVEHEWWALNELGGAVRQMNSGHREGVLVAHYTFSNWIHTTGMASALLRDYKKALKLSKKKEQDYISQMVNNRLKVSEWEAQAAKAETYPNGIIKDIYQHALAVPSKDQVYQQLVNLTTPQEIVDDGANFPLFIIQQGLYIQHSQERILGNLRLKAQTETVKKEVKALRKKLTPKLETFREAQASVVPGLLELMTGGTASVEIEEEVLFLPSDFCDGLDGVLSNKVRELAPMAHLMELEIRMREGDLYDAIKNVQHAAKSVSIHHDYKTKNVKGSNASTRSVHKLEKIRIERDCCINDYNRTRAALIRLGGAKADELPEMKEQDTYRRPTSQPRQLGDSTRTDGHLYSMFPGAGDEEDNEVDQVKYGDLENSAGTEATRRARSTWHRAEMKDKEASKPGKAGKVLQDGWVWTKRLTFGAASRGSQDLSKFEEESDRVAYFRAKAERERWREVREIVQAEFRNCLRAFDRMATEWSRMAERTGPPAPPYKHTGWSFGHRAFAQRHAAMYQQLLAIAQATYEKCLFPPVPDDAILADVIVEERAREDARVKKIIQEQVDQITNLQADLTAGTTQTGRG